jgi:hypothetical protein
LLGVLVGYLSSGAFLLAELVTVQGLALSTRTMSSDPGPIVVAMGEWCLAILISLGSLLGTGFWVGKRTGRQGWGRAAGCVAALTQVLAGDLLGHLLARVPSSGDSVLHPPFLTAWVILGGILGALGARAAPLSRLREGWKATGKLGRGKA